MTFTDEDLQRVKKQLSAKEALNRCFSLTGSEFIELIGRLEAAEEVLTNLRGHEAEIVDEDLMKRWKKASGK